jgi:hypothetical protein
VLAAGEGFDALATPELQRRMGTLLARDDLASVERALVSALHLLERQRHVHD